MEHSVKLYLEDGTSFSAYSIGISRSRKEAHEVVFQTGMTGYMETLTDPSYKDQYLVFTYPMLGNYGSQADKDFESETVHLAGVIVRDLHEPFLEFLSRFEIDILVGVDTRALVTHLRSHGNMGGFIAKRNCSFNSFPLVGRRDLAFALKREERFRGNPSDTHILVVDCGIKEGQIQALLDEKLYLHIIPHWKHVKDIQFYHGLYISNGPGDPTMLHCEVIKTIQAFYNASIPVFGVCMGHLLLALSIGGKTYRMLYGNRGQNVPVILEDEKRVAAFLTSQNHGYEVDLSSLPSSFKPLFTNLNDGSNEGIYSVEKPVFSVQFHPEGKPGPTETSFLFTVFGHLVRNPEMSVMDVVHTNVSRPYISPLCKKKVLVLGSGGLMIGQAGEFDYSGSQALKAYKEQGLFTILINPNVATLQTTTGEGLADKIYSLPVTPDYVQQVILEERPDSIAVQFGGQTAINCAIAMEDFLKDEGVEILGTPLDSINLCEDRALFRKLVSQQGYACAPSVTVSSLEEALEAAKEMGYPLLVRNDFALGGKGSGFAHNDDDLGRLIKATPGAKMLDKSLYGWKEVEYEVLCDRYENAVTVCCMENLDPVGIHTGESIVVAPSQTLNDKVYQSLREAAIKITLSAGIVGECNIQYAIQPDEEVEEGKDPLVYVIEVNPRLSRSSALASKATGYPLAYLAALLSLNLHLPSIRNPVTKTTSAMFEPSLDYCAVKFPRWDLDKFDQASRTIDSAMKSVGETMTIAPTFEEAFMKGIDLCVSDGFGSNNPRLADLVERIWSNKSFEPLTTPWFVQRFTNIRIATSTLSYSTLLNKQLLLQAKRYGFSDTFIAKHIQSTETRVRQERIKHGISPVAKCIDTVAAEFPSPTSYVYLTYHYDQEARSSDLSIEKVDTLVIGSGVYRIGSSVEFDWCAVQTVRALRSADQKVAMLNYNPETVSTDYDEADVLIFDNISLERILDIEQILSFSKVVLSVGGQEANNLAIPLNLQGIEVEGTHPEMIDTAENRFKFSRLLEKIKVDQPRWKELTTMDEAKEFCSLVGYPCLVRPSYVLSGAAMNVAFSDEELVHYLGKATFLDPDKPVVISKFIIDAKEIEVDAVASHGEIVLSAVSEHVENAGVHSGDATLILPPHDLNKETHAKILSASKKIAKVLSIHGPFNIQFIAKDNQVKVIECNLRASRSFPFVSKTLGVNFIRTALKVWLDQPLDLPKLDGSKVGVKVPQFSFDRVSGADCVLGVEMKSTGEVACFGSSVYDAYYKSARAAGLLFPERGSSILVSIGSGRYRKEMEKHMCILTKHFLVWATPGTADYYETKGILSRGQRVSWTTIEHDIRLHNISFVINISMLDRMRIPNSGGYLMRRYLIDNGIPLLTDVKTSKLFIETLVQDSMHSVDTRYDLSTSFRRVRVPGFYDPHVHIREPGDVHKGDWSTESKAAIAGGYTGIQCMPNTRPAITHQVHLDEIMGCARSSAVPFGIFIGGNTDNHKDVIEMAKNPHVCGMKLYLDETHSQGLNIGDWTAVEKHFKGWHNARIAKPIVIHVEYPNLLRCIGLLSIYPVPLHVAHVNNVDMVRVVQAAKDRGFHVTCEVTPHHLFLHSTHTHRKVKPPLEDQRKALIDLVDSIDCFATDHAPHLPEEDGCPGYPGLETAFGLYMTAFPFDLVYEKMIDAPRRIFGVKEDPTTFVELNLDEEWVVPAKLPWSKSGWTPFAGRTLKGKVSKVVIKSSCVFQDGIFYEEHGGYPLTFSPDLFSPSSSSPLTGVSSLSTSSFEEERKTDFESLSTPSSTLSFSTLSTATQVTRSDLSLLFEIATDIRLGKMKESKPLQGKVIGLFFQEPSSRTFMSFASAAQRLGGSTVHLSASLSSMTKGESMKDTGRCFSTMTHLVVGRTRSHKDMTNFMSGCTVPFVNGGDGSRSHPTQALLDLYTIREERGTINGIHLGIIGDLKKGRTVHSLVEMICCYRIRISFFSSEDLKPPLPLLSYLDIHDIPYAIYSLEDVREQIPSLDVLYATRIQRERSSTSSSYIITPELISSAKPSLLLMHPLPRNEELPESLDSDPRAVYLRQMSYGLYLRMALFYLLLR